jgi:hypothetical protein
VFYANTFSYLALVINREVVVDRQSAVNRTTTSNENCHINS